jgi:hypothetical protein
MSLRDLSIARELSKSASAVGVSNEGTCSQMTISTHAAVPTTGCIYQKQTANAIDMCYVCTEKLSDFSMSGQSLLIMR